MIIVTKAEESIMQMLVNSLVDSGDMIVDKLQGLPDSIRNKNRETRNEP